MALITVLAILVLITTVILAFYTHATANRILEASRTNRIKATQINRSATDYITGLFLHEIINPANSSITTINGIAVYTPLANSNAIPERKVSTSFQTDTNAFTLIRQSLPSFDTNVSQDNSATPAKNGRRVSADRWNQPKLIVGTGFSTVDQLPNWIYITGTGGVASTTSTNVIGRFAYNVYQVDGLLNVNAAGYNTAAGLTPAQIAALKATQAGADLTQLGVGSTTVGNLTAFRNPTTYSSADAYLNASGTAAQDGFISPIITSGSTIVLTNNYFACRQDLIRYATMKDSTLATALPYLTHFSRSINAPCAIPATATTANPNLVNIRFLTSGTLTHYNDDGTTTPYPFDTGAPLLQRRFSLAKLAWLTPSGPAAKLSKSDAQYSAGGTDTAIQACFGLLWDGTNARWQYAGYTGSTVQTAIKTLDVVATENREPDFFEVLKAGIAEGSLGLASGASSPLSGQGNPSVQPTLDGAKDLQIIKIGTNIIDCADTDNYPTVIYFSPGGLGVEVAGVEDLPYLHGVDTIFLNVADTVAKTVSQGDLMWTPVFFNPHSSLSGSSSSGPSSITASVVRGHLVYLQLLNTTVPPANTQALTLNSLNLDMSGQSFAVPVGNFRTSPGVMTDAAGAQRLATLVPYVTGNNDVQTFRMFSLSNNQPSVLPIPYTAAMSTRTHMSNVEIALQYTTPGGIVKNYATLGSYDDGNGGIDMGTVYMDSNTGAVNQKNLNGTVYYSNLWDPRTVRLGPSQGWARSSAVNPTPAPDTDYIRNLDPFNWSINAAYLHWGQWPQGGKTGGYKGAPVADYLNARDPDTTTRPADGWLGDNANPYRSLSDMQRRPIILQRPYKNVAELGYVFRDSPWKTLSFFDETSADGALLDLFSVVDEPAITAGRLNPNTAPPQILESLINGITQGSDGTDPLDATAAEALSTAYSSFAHPNQQPSASLPRTMAELPKFMSSTQFGATTSSIIKYRREAVVRALANSAQTRTWNFLIDSVAQSGRFISDTSAGNFIVEGESRCWLSIAIDRYTGEIVSRQWEWVTE
ncbi:MAG: hypothetical protein ACFUZC_10665 [Chthoniobacteraceae bacterium]